MNYLVFKLCIINFILFNALNCSFQMNIFNEIKKKKKGQNLIISPLSIFQILSLAANGARNETKIEMIQTLQHYNIDDLNSINFEILKVIKTFKSVEIANSVMLNFSPVQNFLELAEKYSAPYEKLISANQINNWCKEKTHGKIRKIIDKLNPNVQMLLLNAVYFKGEWVKKFKNKFTEKKIFYNFGTEMKKIDTMTQLTKFRYYEDKQIQAVELPYVDDGMSALIILPREEIDINKYILSLSSDKYNINNIIYNLNYVKVDLELPKFELDFYTSLKEILIDLGMEKAFTDNANFSGLKVENDLKIDDILHKTYLKVNERETEAVAVTAVIGTKKTAKRSTPEIIYQMKVNRPFLFIIRSNKLPFDIDILFISKIEKLE